jgi:fumarate reductase subunit C
MKRSYILPVWLWLLQALTGLALVLYVVIHSLDNATVLISRELYEDMLKLWHESLPHWFYLLMVAALVIAFIIHTLNGIRIASKPYKEIDKSWRHLSMMKHSGTTFWYLQVFTGSIIAIFGVWHLIVQHTGPATTTVDQSILRVNGPVFILYIIFAAALTFHSFNGIRAILIKLGFLTDKEKESILVGFLAVIFVVFFLLGAFSLGKFLLAPKPDEQNLNTKAAISFYSHKSNPGSSYPGAIAEGSCYPGFFYSDRPEPVLNSDDPVDEQRI